MTDQLPATVLPGTLALKADIRLVPGLIADAGEQAGWRYIEFFTANIRNPNTHRTGQRIGQARLRPQPAAAGRNGARSAHSASVWSLP